MVPTERHLRLVAAALLAVVAALRAQAGAPGAPGAPGAGAEVRKSGAVFTVVCHDGDDALADQALAIVEPVWAHVSTMLGAAPDKPAQPLEVHLYRTVEGYEAAEQRLTAGRFRRNLAMSHWDSKTAHVAVQPPCRDEVLRATGLPYQTAAMLAWEAAHVARFTLCANFRDHPAWFADGLAAHVALAVVAKDQPGALKQQPFWSSDVAKVQRLRDAKKLPPAKAIFADAVDDLDLGDRYAARVVFFAFLAAERRAQLGKVAAAIRTTGGGSGYAAKVADAAKGAFGAGVDREFAKWLGAQRPQWSEVFRSLAVRGDDTVQLAFADKNAIAWRSEPVAGAFDVRGRLRILPGEQRQLNFLFAKTDAGFHSIAFVADKGFTVFDYVAANDRFDRLGDANAPGLRLGVTSEFRIEATGRKLTIHLDDKHWDFELPRALPKGVTWGLGAQAGSAGIWQGVTARAGGQAGGR